MAFMEILRNRTELVLFAEYLCELHAEESLEFWISVEIYRLLPSSAERVLAARNIYNRFIKRLAPREVNVDAYIREQITDRMVDFQIDSALFEEAQLSVFQLLEYNCYARFQEYKRSMSTTFLNPKKLARAEKAARGKPALDPEMILYLDSLAEPKQGKRIKPKSVAHFLFPEQQQTHFLRSRSTPDHTVMAPVSLRRRSPSAMEIGRNSLPTFSIPQPVYPGLALDPEVQFARHRSVSAQVLKPKSSLLEEPKLRRMTSRFSVNHLLPYNGEHLQKSCSAPQQKARA